MRSMILAAALVLIRVGAPAAQETDKEKPIAAVELMKVYASGAAEFDKAYKGKTLTVEGIVRYSNVKDGPKTFLMIEGYKKPGDNFTHDVRCVETTDFEGIRIGHKVRIRGTVQEHRETSTAAELRECKVVKVFADEYPPSKAVKEEMKKLQGQWKVVTMEANGKKLTGAEAPFTKVSVEGYNVYLHQNNGAVHFGVNFDLAKDPKWIDLLGANATLPSIYTLDGDKLQLYLPALLKGGGFRRSSNFDTVKNAGILLKAERQK
jgi:uncharacterized protein (TIGR03067 family)